MGLVITAEVAISFYETVIVYVPEANDGVLHVAWVVEATLISKHSVLVPKYTENAWAVLNPYPLSVMICPPGTTDDGVIVDNTNLTLDTQILFP